MSVLGLYGREAETRALDDALDLLACGRRAIVLLEGEAGIGKTRLLAETLDRARSRGYEVARGKGEELERTRPFGLVADAFGCVPSSRDSRRSAIAGLLDVQGGGDGPPITVTSDPSLQFRAIDAFVDLVEEVALRRPLLIGLDDLQWADPSSVLTIGAVARRLGDLPVALVGCFRPLPYATQLQRLAAALDAAGARHLILRSLPEPAVSGLAAEALGADPGPGLLAELGRAAGNPLFVTELLDTIKRGGITVTGIQADLTDHMLPATLRLTILRRLGFLGEETLQVLRVASILGSSFSLTDLSIVTDRPALDLSVTLAEAAAAGVVNDDGARLRFSHDLIRDAIYEELPRSVRLGLHREAGQRLAAAGLPAQQVAEQLARGAMPEQAVQWLIRAGREAASTSPVAAASLLERAIALMAPTDPARDRVLAERAASLLQAGRASDAGRACRALLSRAHDPAVEESARICLGHALLAGGRPGDALQEFEAVAEVTQTGRANALGWASLARLRLGDLDGAASAARQARSAATAVADPLATSMALGTLATLTEFRRGHLRDARQLIDDAVRIADQTPGRQGHRYPLHAERALILAELDRLDEAAATLRAGRRICEELGVGWHLPSYLATTVVQRFIIGEWDDAIAEIEASIELADETGVTHSLVLSYGVLSLIKLHRNDIAGAVSAAETAAADLPATGPRYLSQWAEWARVLTLEADGRPGDAFTALAQVWDECAAVGFEIEFRVLGPDLVRLALSNGDQRRATQVVSAVARLAEENDVPSLTGAALRCRGLSDDDPGALTAAVDAYARAPRPLELAQACEDAGVALAREASRDPARQFIERALEIYEALGASRDVLRTEAALRELGVRRGRRGTRARPETGWDSLSPSERAVADLVAQGLSNPQVGERLYVSRRTVQTHLAHIFAKLEISSRAQLAAEVARRG